jgi:hypothetical protein
MIDNYLMSIPGLVCYWSGILIAWSMITILGLGIALYRAKQRGYTRKSDILMMLLIIAMGGFLVISMTVFPLWLRSIIDVVVIIDLWFMLLLIHVDFNVLMGYHPMQALNFFLGKSQHGTKRRSGTR